MGRRRKGEPPRLNHHRSSGQGYVTIAGRRIYLGPFGSAECRRAYRAELQRWEEETKPRVVGASLYLGRGAKIRDLVTAFLREVADVRYQIDGEPTSTYRLCQLYLVDGLAKQYGDLPADEFRHPEFEEFRRQYLQRGYSRNSMAQLRGRVLVLFRWGHRRGAVSAETLTSLASSSEPGEGEEREPIEPVPEADLRAVLRALTPDSARPPVRRDYPAARARLSTMLQVQELVGMRPGELCRMRRREIRLDGTVKIGNRTVQVVGADGEPYQGWVFQPSRHKNIKRGKQLAYLVGPKARALLTPYLPDDPEGYLWRGRIADTHLTHSAYKAAIRVACKLAGVPNFAPNQLRHSAATRYERLTDLIDASKILGHASPQTTAVYVSKSLSGISGIVEKYG